MQKLRLALLENYFIECCYSVRKKSARKARMTVYVQL